MEIPDKLFFQGGVTTGIVSLYKMVLFLIFEAAKVTLIWQEGKKISKKAIIKPVITGIQEYTAI